MKDGVEEKGVGREYTIQFLTSWKIKQDILYDNFHNDGEPKNHSP